jgi:hypothetical protein
MAKRFTDTDKWKKPFIRGLKSEYKILWLYILDECDHAGVWQVDFDVAKIKIGEPNITEQDALLCFGDRVICLEGKWFINDFIDFQYGELNPANRVHKSVIDIISKFKNKPLISPLQGAKDKDKEKDKDKDINIPSYLEFLEYAKTLPIYKPTFDYAITAKYNAWVADGWRDGHNKPIKNWKTTLQNTFPYFKEVSINTTSKPPRGLC